MRGAYWCDICGRKQVVYRGWQDKKHRFVCIICGKRYKNKEEVKNDGNM